MLYTDKHIIFNLHKVADTNLYPSFMQLSEVETQVYIFFKNCGIQLKYLDLVEFLNSGSFLRYLLVESDFKEMIMEKILGKVYER